MIGEICLLLRVLKLCAFAPVFLILSWVLWPEPVSLDEEDAPQATSEAAPDIKHVLRVSCGHQYLPGTVPAGIGKELEGMDHVVDAFEARFPDTKVELVAVPIEREYLVTQLSSGNAPDILNVNVEDVWVDIQKGWYLPLDPYLEAPNPFIVEQGDPDAPGSNEWWDMFANQAISRGKAAPDGKNYCLSYDLVETGIFYNKDLFAEQGIEVPKTWEELLAIMGMLKENDIIPMIMYIDSFNDWCTDLLFDQLYYDLLPGIDLIQDPTREAYLEGYLDWDEIAFLFKKGFFTQKDPRYAELWRIMYEFRQYCARDLGNEHFMRDFTNQDGAMVWHFSGIVHRLENDPDLGFEWGVFYLPPLTKKTSKYASEDEMCVIGGAATQFEVTNSAFKDTGDPATSERLQRVIAFLQFLCVPEQYEKVVNEYPCFAPNIVGVEALPPLQPFVDILEHRYTSTKWIFSFDLRFFEIQRRMLELYLNDGASQEEFLSWQVENIRAATENLLQRKDIDMATMQARWDELAPVRATMEDLPDGL
jgi:raffinose/stachyose/melibiose transport system substrate-binding protein